MKTISRSTIKIIALIAMLIDHIAAGPIDRALRLYCYNNEIYIWQQLFENQHINYGILFAIDQLMRAIGRISFPIYCFMLVEGYIYTKSKIKYLIRLLILAIISEIPFDLLFSDKVIYPDNQNVFFTLAIGLTAIWLIDIALKLFDKILNCDKYPKGNNYKVIKLLSALSTVTITAVMAYVSYIIKCDYSYSGVVTIVTMYLLKMYGNVFSFCAGCIILSIDNVIEVFAMMALPVVRAYSGEKGSDNKYLFYFFYPAHIFVLYLLCKILGI